MPTIRLHRTVGVKVGPVQIGGGAPIAVQSMTNTDTPDVGSTAQQCIELAQAGSELVRITVNLPEAAAAENFLGLKALFAGAAVGELLFDHRHVHARTRSRAPGSLRNPGEDGSC